MAPSYGRRGALRKVTTGGPVRTLGIIEAARLARGMRQARTVPGVRRAPPRVRQPKILLITPRSRFVSEIR
jgi:hypothetical protein